MGGFLRVPPCNKTAPTQTNTLYLHDYSMGCFRVLLAVFFPPLAVLDKGCGSFLIVLLLTLCGWVPGVIAALIILNNPN